MFCHLMHLYANFQMGHLETFEFSPQVHSQANSQLAVPKFPFQIHDLKNPQWKLSLLQNNPQICHDSTLKNYLKHPQILP